MINLRLAFSLPRYLPFLFTVLALLAIGALAMHWGQSTIANWSHSNDLAGAKASPIEATKSSIVRFPPEQWAASAIEVKPATRAAFSRTIRMTGKITLNEDRVAHIYPMVEGTIDSVHVQLGQHVRANDLLLIIHSREVGKAKLDLYQSRLSQEMALVRHERTKQITDNTNALLADLRNDLPINDIESKFRSRPMGDFRQQLLTAYANYYKSQVDFDRLESLGDRGAIAVKQFVSAEAARNADRATFQACLEQITYDLENSMLTSSQAVKQLTTQVAVAETNLKILGYEQDELNTVNPATEGESISHYPIRAPFDGTVISKDVALLEHTRPDVQLLSLVDLSSVWVTADVYEENLPILQSQANKSIIVRNEAWPDRKFIAKVFYTGEIMDPSSRTISMRALANNDEGLLKPGMFVTVELPVSLEAEVLQLPDGAIQEHEGQKFVFVHTGGDEFERRSVTVGRINEGMVEILDGLQVNDAVVVNGGFILKSRMLAKLMGGD